MNPHAQDPDRRCLPITEWPDGDKTVWAAILKKASPLDNPGPGAKWRPVTEKTWRTRYGRWLTFIKRHKPEAWKCEPLDRLTPSNLDAYIARLQDQNLKARTILHYLVGLLIVAQRVGAKQNWLWLRQWVHHFDALAREQGGPAYRVPPIDLLFNCALTYMDTSAEKPPHLKLDVHVRFRDGLMIALEAARSLRMKNVVMIELNKHMIRMDEVWWLTFSGAEIKTGEPYKAPLPTCLAPYIERYLETHRPALLQGAQTQAFWISNKARAMTASSLSHRIRIMTERLLGYALTPHAFRHTAATSIAIDHPELLRTTPAVLHHKSGATAERYYTMASSTTASRRYQSVISNLRKENF